MENGLKRLWTRRKSKGPDAQRDPGIRSLRKVQSTDQKGLTSVSAQRPSRAIKTSAGNGPNQFKPVSSTDDSLRPPSSGRVQPTLVGVSRPATALSRPGTASSGSLMNAVNRAADAVTVAEQEYRQSAERYTNNYIRPKAPRYVDIFSLSNPSSPKVYNEHVAERNLDLARVALEDSQSPNGLSKFQEDVAARNAYPPLPGGNSVEVSPYSGSSSQPPDRVRPSTSAFSNRPFGNATSEDRPASMDPQAQDSMTSHSRQYSDRSWGSQSQQEAFQARKFFPGPGSPQAQNMLSTELQSPKVASHLSGNPAIPLSRQLIGAQVAQVGNSDGFRGENLRNYVLSQSELIHSRSSDRAQLQQSNTARSVDGHDGTQASDRSIRSPSALSNTSSVKRTINLPHRTIMDLTGDDSEVFSEVSPESIYSASPVVESAKADTMRRLHPAIISQTPKPDFYAPPIAAEIKSFSQPPEEVPTLIPGVAPSHSHNQPVSETPAPKPPINTVAFTSSFSPISTIADLEPRRSVIIDSRLTNSNIEAEKHHSDPHDVTEVPPLNMNETVRSNDNLHQDLSTIEAISGEETQAIVSEVAPETTQISELGLETSSADANTTEADSADQSVTQSNQTSPTEMLDTSATPQSQSNIQLTPESLHSIDFVDPSRAFGVTTRDFATTPSKAPLASVPEDIEPSTSIKARRPINLTIERRATSHDSGTAKFNATGSRSTSAYKSTFDEDEFAQKQADARAALVRLQQSLNENFLTHPPPTPTVQSSKTLRHHSSLSDGKPVAPSSIFAQVRNISPSPADYRLSVGTSTSSDDARPQSSYHSLTTISQSNGQPPTRNSASSSEGIDQILQHDKGKQKPEIDTDGPGPSILDEEHDMKHPLPLPPPLHLNGHALYRNLNQAPVPPSPGEISLSSFPIPVSSPRQSFKSGPDSPETVHQTTAHHSHQNSAGTGRVLRRQSSQRSQESSASAFSIPYHMIPDRSSSMRDRSVRDDNDL